MENGSHPTIHECIASLEAFQNEVSKSEDAILLASQLIASSNSSEVIDANDIHIFVDGRALNMGDNKEDREIIRTALCSKIRSEVTKLLALNEHRCGVLSQLMDCLDEEESK